MHIINYILIRQNQVCERQDTIEQICAELEPQIKATNK